jgi:hypothetical protein
MVICTLERASIFLNLAAEKDNCNAGRWKMLVKKIILASTTG